MSQTRTAAAVEANLRFAAERTAADPKKLDRAIRAVRVALEAGTLTIAELSAKAGRR